MCSSFDSRHYNTIDEKFAFYLFIIEWCIIFIVPSLVMVMNKLHIFAANVIHDRTLKGLASANHYDGFQELEEFGIYFNKVFLFYKWFFFNFITLLKNDI